MRKMKGISYNPEKDNKLIEYIDSQDNGSKYMLRLVRQDINKQSTLYNRLKNIIKGLKCSPH